MDVEQVRVMAFVGGQGQDCLCIASTSLYIRQPCDGFSLLRFANVERVLLGGMSVHGLTLLQEKWKSLFSMHQIRIRGTRQPRDYAQLTFSALIV